MGEISYSDELTKESVNIPLKFKCREPFKLWRNIEDIMKTVLEIESSKFYTKIIGWDTTDGRFRGEWEARKSWDRWTKLVYKVRCWGQQTLGDPEKNGNVKIKIIGSINTSYYYSNSIQKSLWWSYNYMFYNHNRLQAYDEGRELYFRIMNEIKKLYGVYRAGDENIAFH